MNFRIERKMPEDSDKHYELTVTLSSGEKQVFVLGV
jgi:hypothetical protein